MDYTSLYQVRMGYTRQYWVILGYTRLYWVLLGYTGLYWVLLGYTRLYWVLLGFTAFYWVILGYAEFRCCIGMANLIHGRNVVRGSWRPVFFFLYFSFEPSNSIVSTLVSFCNKDGGSPSRGQRPVFRFHFPVPRSRLKFMGISRLLSIKNGRGASTFSSSFFLYSF